MSEIDETHDPARRSFVPGADDHADFPIQNLPFGIFSPPGGAPRGGVAIGDMILDLPALLATGLLGDAAAEAAQAASGPALNPLLALGRAPRRALRRRLSQLLSHDSDAHETIAPLLYLAANCRMHLPARVGDYTDFFAGIHHATNTGRLFRPDNPLLPNYKHIPVGYHGRASSLVPSGVPVRRPRGQLKSADRDAPAYLPSRRLDYELELGVWIGPGNDLGTPIPMEQAAAHIAGYCLLNDWSARDVQGWEAQPLGPFLAKSFATTLSVWLVTPEALAPFRVAQAARPDGDPQPLPHLLDAADQHGGALDLQLEVLLQTTQMRERGLAPHRLALSNARHLYWTVAQLVAHHASGGCNLQPGDLFGSGTISAPSVDGYGSILEITRGGKDAIALPSGEERRFLEDGDEVFLRAHAMREGFAPIGFGECRAVILAAP